MKRNTKYTTEEVEKILLNYGFIMKSDYIDNQTKIESVCLSGHPRSMVLPDYRRYPKCSTCKKEKQKKNKYKEIKKELELNDYRLLTELKYFTNSKTNLDIKCPKGHLRSVNIYRFRTTQCKECLWEEQRSDTVKQIKATAKANGYELIEDTYINAKEKFDVKCKNGHIRSIKFDALKNGNECIECYHNKLAITREKRDQEYSLVCDNGHNYTTTSKKSQKCPYCLGLKTHPEEVKAHIEENGYTLVNKFLNSTTKIDLKCPKGHKWSTLYSVFKKGHRCPTCDYSKRKNAF